MINVKNVRFFFSKLAWFFFFNFAESLCDFSVEIVSPGKRVDVKEL